MFGLVGFLDGTCLLQLGCVCSLFIRCTIWESHDRLGRGLGPIQCILIYTQCRRKKTSINQFHCHQSCILSNRCTQAPRMCLQRREKKSHKGNRQEISYFTYFTLTYFSGTVPLHQAAICALPVTSVHSHLPTTLCQSC